MRRSLLCLLCLMLPAAVGAEEKQDKPILVLDAGGHTAFVRKVLFTPDGKELITVADDKTVRFWDVKTGEPLRVLRPPVGPGQEGMLWTAALSPSGTTLAVGGYGNLSDKWGDIYLITLTTGRIELVLTGHTKEIHNLAFSLDGRHLASGSADTTARLWDVATGKCEQVLREHSGVLFGITFSSDSRRVATASSDGTGRVWSVATGKSEAVLGGHTKAFGRIAWSPDGKTPKKEPLSKHEPVPLPKTR